MTENLYYIKFVLIILTKKSIILNNLKLISTYVGNYPGLIVNRAKKKYENKH